MAADRDASRFTAQGATAEDLLKTQTVGLVNLSDYKKRRAEALEQKEREASEGYSRSGTATPNEGALTPNHPAKKKKKKHIASKGKLSFAFDGDDDGDGTTSDATPLSKTSTPRSTTPGTGPGSPAIDSDGERLKPLGPNAGIAVAPKVRTKAALLKEAQTREQLRKDFVAMQAAVKATPFAIPFVFFDGSNIDGGILRMKKGDHVWLFLDRSRKIGADKGVGGSGAKGVNNRREWARVSVDDLMLVRGELIIPHHYEFYYFMLNKTVASEGSMLFPYSDKPTAATPTTISEAPTPEPSNYDPISRPSATTHTKDKTEVEHDVLDLEGSSMDPAQTKVVDRRWYERNKHIFPASTWTEFDPTKDYTTTRRTDAQGNAFFF